MTDFLPKAVFALLAGTVVATQPAHAVFELQGPTPRAMAIGGAGSALIDDASALYYNPAGLAALSSTNAAFSHNRIGNFDFLQHSLAYVGFSLGRLGSAATGVRTFATRSSEGERLASEFTISIAHGITIMEDVHSSLAVGWAAHLHQLDFGTSAGTYVPATESYVGGIDLGSASAVGFDVGVRANLEGRTFLSAVLRNLNRPTLGETDRVQLLEALTLGAAYEPYPDVITTGEVELRSGEAPSMLRAGMEYRIVEMLTLRVGVGSEPARFSGGARVAFGNFAFDYAFGDHPILPASHYLGVGVEF